MTITKQGTLSSSTYDALFNLVSNPKSLKNTKELFTANLLGKLSKKNEITLFYNSISKKDQISNLFGKESIKFKCDNFTLVLKRDNDYKDITIGYLVLQDLKSDESYVIVHKNMFYSSDSSICQLKEAETNYIKKGALL